MEYIVKARSAKAKKLIELTLPSMLHQLGIANARKALVITLEKDCDDSGLTVPMPAVDGFVVVIKSNQTLDQIGLALAHELVHVRQMSKGVLRSLGRGAHMWAGKKYSKKTPYLSRPWELDAFAKQEIVFRRALDIV